jgi:hypothetical protein
MFTNLRGTKTKSPGSVCHRGALHFSNLFNVAASSGKSPRTQL